MKTDKNLIAAVIGAIATIPSEIISLIFVRLGYARYSIYHLSSMLVTQKTPSFTMGIVVSPVVGGFIAIILYQAFRKLGAQHLIIKCIGVALLMFIALEFIFSVFYDGKLIPSGRMSADYSHLISAIIYGITEGLLFGRFLFYKKIE